MLPSALVPKVLLTWIGLTDLKAADGDASVGQGPIAHAVTARSYDHVVLLCDRPKKDGEKFRAWISTKTSASTVLRAAPLKSPTDYEDIYRRVRENVAWARAEYGAGTELAFHLSPGTPPMAVIWILVGTTERAELLQSSREQGVQTVKVPFQIAAEFIPALIDRAGSDLESLASGVRPVDPSFDDILHRSTSMKVVIDKARLAAVVHSAPVLIEGESGTGKELLAAAIHKASGRKGRFIPVNCGAIPKDLVESEFFGHKRGSFTGATDDRDGHFLEAEGGTLFLDEVSELPLGAQVKLLRAVQEKKIVRVGESRARSVDIRLVSATNCDLTTQVLAKAFREDLYYRLAVLRLRVPPLREREGDILLLAEHIFQEQQRKLEKTSARKKLSPGAKSVLLRHRWPGNVRELDASLLRALVWSTSATITEDDMRDALAIPSAPAASVLDRPLGNGFDLKALLDDVSTHYIRRAMAASPQNKTEAAKLIGFRSQQLLTQWMKRLDVEGSP